MVWDHPKFAQVPEYGLYYSCYSAANYGILPIPDEGGPKLFHWHFHAGFECCPGDLHPLDHGLCRSFEDAQKQAEAFESLWIEKIL